MIDGLPSFTEETYQGIIQCIRGELDSQLQGLESLAQLLAYGSTEIMGNFPIQEICYLITKQLDESPDEKVRRLAAHCIFAVLEAHCRSTANLMESHALIPLSKNLLEISDLETSQFCIRAIEVISNFRAAQVGQEIGIEPLLKKINFFQIPFQQNALAAVSRITQAYIRNDFGKELPLLYEFSNNPDKKISQNAITSLNLIVQSITPTNIPKEIIHLLCKPDSILKYLKSIVKISKDEECIKEIISADIDFEKILMNPLHDSILHKMALVIIINMLPESAELKKYGILFDEHQRPSESVDFAKKIQPTLLKYFQNLPLAPEKAFISLIQTIPYQKFDLTEELIVSFLNLSADISVSCYIVIILLNYIGNPLIEDSGIMTMLKKTSTDLKSANKRKYNAAIKRIEKQFFQSKNIYQYDEIFIEEMNLSSIIDLVKNNKVNKLEFLTSELVKKCKSLIMLEANNDSIKTEDRSVLEDFVASLLQYVPIVPQIEYFEIDSLIDRFRADIHLLCKHDDMSMNFNVPIKSSFLDIIGFLNEEMPLFTKENLIEKFKTNESLLKIFPLEANQEICSMKVAVIGKALYESEYPDYIFKTENFLELSANSSILDLLIMTESLNENYMEVVFEKKNYNEVSSVQNMFMSSKCKKQLKGNSKCFPITNILDILWYLNIHTKKRFIQEQFVHKVSNLLINTSLLYNKNIGAYIIYNYPFLFPFEQRLFVFRMFVYDPIGRLKLFISEFYPNKKTNFSQEILKFTINRENLFEDGIEMLKHFCSNRVKCEISFQGDVGFGIGPTCEFFTMMSHEFAKKKNGLFRNDFNSNLNNEYCHCKKGLFPLPNANLELMNLLGRFIMKAFSLGCLIDIDFNPFFFDLVLNEETKIDIADVDEQLANSLKNKEGLYGLSFTYPGLDDFELKTNGKDIMVDKDNVDEYIGLIIRYTCGEGLAPVIDAFCTGINSIFDLKSMRMFYPEEMNRLFNGEQRRFKEIDFQHIVVSHGYTPECSQIQWLFQIILEMTLDEQHDFIQFVTGFKNLPIGGLKSLEPRLTIAKRTDGSDKSPDSELPSVMTCTHYLKIPGYSSLEIMRKQFMIAIKEGKEQFQLS